jgi:calcium-dependent protein kinase
MKGSASALGLDKMIDEKRDAKSMSERVVHIEVPFGKPIEEVYSGVHDGPVLGSGISGLVRLATHRATGLKYAVKCLDLGLVDTEEGLQQLREEIYIMCQLDHPNIVRLEEVYESHSEIYLVQELCLGGELFDRLDEQPDYHYTEAQCARLIKQMLCSVRYIHSKGIIHRDLKLENFLFSDTGADSELKMIDFGLSKHFKFGEVQHEAVGTPYTVAPEVIRGSYDERCDVWAIGVITYLLLSGESPFGGCGGPEPLVQVRDNILRCNFVFEPEDIWEQVSEKAKQFIRKLLVTDPNLRPTAREVQKDEWLLEMAERLKKDDDDNKLNPSVVKALVNFKEYSDMRKLLCEVLSFTLIPDQIQGLRKEFEKMDTDGSGEISLKALKSVLLGNAEKGTLGALTEEEVEDIFNAMRVSSAETTIHWHEFIAAGLSHCKVDERNLKLAFDRLDADHTGYITFENFMDLIGNGAGHSEEVLREMWGEASMNNEDAYITYEDFLLLMKGQSKPSKPAQSIHQPMLKKLPLQPVMESLTEPQTPEQKTKSLKSSINSSFVPSPSSFEDDLSDGPLIMDDDDDGLINSGFSEAMRHQKGGVVLKESLAKPPTDVEASPTDTRGRSKSVGSEEAKDSPVTTLVGMNSLRAINLPEHVATDEKLNSILNDKTKSSLVVNRELYRAHRSMRLAVLDASKRLEEEQQRRAREEMRKEQARTRSAGAGLIMRHGGELSADAIKQFVAQRKKEEEQKVQEAKSRGGRRHNRNKTASDIRGMFGGSGSELSNLTLPTNRENAAPGGIPNFNHLRPPLTPTTPTKSSIAPDLPELPEMRGATKPGQFRKTNYDPFRRFGVSKKEDTTEGGDNKNGDLIMDSSFHKHLDAGVGFRKLKSDEHKKLALPNQSV